VELFFDERLVVPDEALSLDDGALAPWRKGKSPYFLQTIEAIAKHYEFDPTRLEGPAGAKVQQVFLRGSGERKSSSAMTRAGASTRSRALRRRDPEHGAPLSRDR
jgi:excinuclease UvrABC ATPase subunit